MLYFVMYKMAILPKIKSHSDVINYFKNTDPLVELPFYEQLSVTKTDLAFKGHAMSYKVEIIEKMIQLHNQSKLSKLSIKKLFSDLLNELKGFKYQITVKFY